ncbi:MAG: hypothetical protein AB7N65_22945 [Vicinamibacterales bacterium]
MVRRSQPSLTNAEAALEAADFNRLMAERRADLSAEFARVSSYDDMVALSPAELFARWLEAHSVPAEAARLQEHGPKEVALPPPAPEPEFIGCVQHEHTAYVVYRWDWQPVTPETAARIAHTYREYPAEERAYLVDPVTASLAVVALRRQADGAWRLPADHWPLRAGAWVGFADLVDHAGDGSDTGAA